jgi:hypothetical protein
MANTEEIMKIIRLSMELTSKDHETIAVNVLDTGQVCLSVRNDDEAQSIELNDEDIYQLKDFLDIAADALRRAKLRGVDDESEDVPF